MISKFDIQKLRDLNIETVASRLGMTVKRKKAICPFHDDTIPSLTFYPRNNTYRCFVCDAHGGVIDLVMNKLHKSFPEACRWLADESNVIIEETSITKTKTKTKTVCFDASRYTRFFECPFINDMATRFLYDERRIDPRVVRWCRLNSYRDPKDINWLQIPYFDMDGKLVGVQSRNLDYVKGGRTPRFKFPQNAECHIYNLPVLKLLRPEESLFITEGCSDCWAMLSSGHKAVAIPSATLLREGDLLPIRKLVSEKGITLHMYPDRDEPGSRLYLQLKELLPSLVYHQLPDGFKDYSDFYISKIQNSTRQ